MRTFRMFGMALIAVLMCVNFASCSDDENVTSQDGEEVVVSLGFGGDFKVSESPLSRAEGENNDLYFIMVYQNEKQYAYGLFDNSTEIAIKLETVLK